MRDFNDPNCNADHLACKFRNAVMPARGRLHDQKSILVRINRVRTQRVNRLLALQQ
jgi:hypothetical protein